MDGLLDGGPFDTEELASMLVDWIFNHHLKYHSTIWTHEMVEALLPYEPNLPKRLMAVQQVLNYGLLELRT
jgi:hypothetical protein